LAQKLPEICNQTEDIKIREKLAFVLGQVNRFDDAITELQTCISRVPDNFFTRNSIAYTAYNSLYAAKNREIFLNGKPKKDRIELAHFHFREAQRLRPDGITNYYRQGMLYRQIENKSVPAMPLFLKAVENWDKLTPDEKKDRHQQRKNFVKSLYQGASLVLEYGSAKKTLKMIKRCISEDEKSDYIL